MNPTPAPVIKPYVTYSIPVVVANDDKITPVLYSTPPRSAVSLGPFAYCIRPESIIVNENDARQME